MAHSVLARHLALNRPDLTALGLGRTTLRSYPTASR